MQYFSTATVPARERLQFWNDVAAQSLMHLEIRPLDELCFEGALHSDRLGELGVARASSTRATLRRTRGQIALSGERVFLISLAERGGFTSFQRGRAATLREGDFIINDSAEPFELMHRSACEAIVIRVPERLMKTVMPMSEELAGLCVSGSFGIGAITSTTLRSLGQQMQQGLCSEIDPRADQGIVALIASACASQLGARVPQSRSGAWRRLQIKRFLEAHLHEPGLSVARLATVFRISERQLRAVFAPEGEGICAYILRRRLEECARRLRSPVWTARTVSEIAFSWGFNSHGSFDRAFKQRYRITPQQFRRGPAGAGD